MHKIFIQAFAFNSSTAFIYKILLLVHQIILYSIIPKSLYGIQSSMFAAIYTAIAITNFGFEESLLPFFSIYSQSKQQFMQAIRHFMGHIISLTCITYIFYLTFIYSSGAFLHNIQGYCNKNIIFITLAIFFIESIKKSTVAMMQLAFFNKQIAYAEISMLLSYLATVWGLYTIYKNITITTIFIPMLITSSLELLYLGYYLIQFYQQLPDAVAAPYIPFKVLFQERFYNYINQIIKTVYSPNSMTIFFAYLFGFQQAATIKFYTTIITLLHTCITKSIGVTSGAALAAMKGSPLPIIQQFFQDLTTRYVQFLLILSIILISIVGHAWYIDMITIEMAGHIMIFFSISFLEHVTITYDQLFISHHKASLLAYINATGLFSILTLTMLYRYQAISLPSYIGMIILIKLCCLIFIVYQANKHWTIKTPQHS